MKAADKLAARLGANIDESMGARRNAPAPGFTPTAGPPQDPRYASSSRARGAYNIPVDRLVPDPNQPRKSFDQGELVELAASLRTRGQLQPIRARWDASLGTWVIVTGERRWRAAQLAGLTELTVIEHKDDRSDAELLEDQLVENCLRADLSPLEQAHAFRALIDARQCSVRQLAESLSVSHQSILRALKLLDLSDDLQAEVQRGNLAPSVATELAEIPEPAERSAVAREIVSRKLNRDNAVKAIRQAPSRARAAQRPKATRSGKTTKARPVLFRVEGGMSVEVTGPASQRAALDPGAVLRALRQALAQAEALHTTSTPSAA